MPTHQEMERVIEAFVRGFCTVKSATHPYEHSRIGSLWWMRDAPRKNPKLYRKEEWIAYRVAPADVDRVARDHTRGWYFICMIRGNDEPDDPLRQDYKQLGYRLLATEPLFVHRLKRIPRREGTVIEQVTTAEKAEQFAKATRTRPIPAEHLANDAPFRQFVAVVDGQIIGWVRSVGAGNSTWCSSMYVRPVHRRRGVGTALLCHMLRDDRRRGFEQSVLLSSHTGALVYPRVGYEQLGMLYIFAPRKRKAIS
jgi:GNAT superfamily N-acetyltransferase